MTNYQSLRPKGIKSALSLTYYESAQWPRTALRTAAISSSDAGLLASSYWRWFQALAEESAAALSAEFDFRGRGLGGVSTPRRPLNRRYERNRHPEARPIASTAPAKTAITCRLVMGIKSS